MHSLMFPLNIHNTHTTVGVKKDHANIYKSRPFNGFDILWIQQGKGDRTLTICSVSNRLPLSSYIQTQITSLRKKNRKIEWRQIVKSGVCAPHSRVLHTSLQAMGSVLKRELVSSTDRRFL